MKILSIEFNVEVPDSLFDLQIPRSAEVYDGVSELGFLEPGNRPASVFPEEARRRRWIGIGLALVLGVFCAVMVAKKVRQRNGTMT